MPSLLFWFFIAPSVSTHHWASKAQSRVSVHSSQDPLSITPRLPASVSLGSHDQGSHQGICHSHLQSPVGRQNRHHQAQLHRLFRVQSWAICPWQSGSGGHAWGAQPALWEAPWVVLMPDQCGGPRMHLWVPGSFCYSSRQGGDSCLS